MFGLFKKKEARRQRLKPLAERSAFFSTDDGRFFEGWATGSNSIDAYLQSDWTKISARSRELVRTSPYGKRFISLMVANIVGSKGINVQARVIYNSRGQDRLDEGANKAIEAAWNDFCKSHCDFLGRRTMTQIEKGAISSAAQDGFFVYRKHLNKGKYGLQLEEIDPYLVDTTKNETLMNGGQVRLGMEYDASGKWVRTHFRERDYAGSYNQGKNWSLPAKSLIVGFKREFPDQSIGIPWMHAGLTKAKHLEKYQEAAIVKARSTAATMGFFSGEGDDEYRGEEVEGYDGVTLDQFEPGTVKDIGNRQFVGADFSYPHQMYESFIKSCQRDLAAAWGVSYQALTTDLTDVNFSSARTGTLEDREHYKDLQEWFIDDFVRPVYEEFISMAVMKGAIKIGRVSLSRPIDDYFPAHFQGRRWDWVDPMKDGQANQLALSNNLKSMSQIMREQGNDPESTWREIARERDFLQSIGLSVNLGDNENEEDTESDAQPDDRRE